MQDIIDVKNLTKRFGDFTAVDDISFSVQPQEIFAFLGPNGAGKSVTIKMLITLLKANQRPGYRGRIRCSTHSADVRNTIGYVPQSISVDGTLTAYENMMLMARLYEVPRNERKDRIKEVLDFLVWGSTPNL